MTNTSLRDPFENLSETADAFANKLSITCTRPELELIRKLAELIGTRAARLSACGVAAISKKKGYKECHVGADGSVFNKYPHFKQRGAVALREILDWPAKKRNAEDPIEILAAEDGSGVGAALIAALTLQRVKAGNMAGIQHPENYKWMIWSELGINVSKRTLNLLHMVDFYATAGTEHVVLWGR